MNLESSTSTLILATFILLWPSTTAAADAAVTGAACNQTCGFRKFPFPFGFSSACQIQLNCRSNSTVLAADFPVLTTTTDAILVTIPTDCSRPVEALRRLYTRNYAPNSFNAVLLHNCSGDGPPTPCFIPTTTVKANFELVDCGRENDSVSCYSETNNLTSFLNYENLLQRHCRLLFSAISIESLEVSVLDVRVLRLGWWILGNCSCSDNAECAVVLPPVDGDPAAYRCLCKQGYVGDGFRGGAGCRRESRRCNISKYISGQCGGVARILVLAGGAAAAATLIAMVAGLFCFFRRQRSRSRSQTQFTRKLTETADINIPVYSYKEMERATSSFCDKKMLGTGAYGTVYSGKLSNDKRVAIKRIRNRDPGSIEHIINEIKLLSSVSHPNLVQLLGCSIENEHILVYEYMPNGTLSQHLQGEKGDGLAWPVRLNIAIETAQALSYLHNALHPPVYHRDVKSSNILLDYNYRSKVADFGLSRLGMAELSHVSTAPQGTPGYVDPQYHQHFHLSDKSDVYSFGVVLIEIITALRVVDFSRPPNEINLAALAVDRIGRGCLAEIIDPFIVKSERDECKLSTVYKVAELAFRCLAFDREMRPSMMEVAIELEQIAMSQKTNSDAGVFDSSETMTASLKSVDSAAGNEEPRDSLCKVSSGNSLEMKRDFSRAVSDRNSWQSDDGSSPSSNCLLTSENK